MCRPVRCRQCGKTTWAGCGDHVESVKAKVPDEQWCPGHDVEAAHEQSHHGGFLARVLRRS
jgi:hypothetical protein